VVGFVSGTGESRSGGLASLDADPVLGGETLSMLSKIMLCVSECIEAGPEEFKRALAGNAGSFGLFDSAGAGLAAVAFAMPWLRLTGRFSKSSLPTDRLAF
jgi:hypothetical protein